MWNKHPHSIRMLVNRLVQFNRKFHSPFPQKLTLHGNSSLNKGVPTLEPTKISTYGSDTNKQSVFNIEKHPEVSIINQPITTHNREIAFPGKDSEIN